MKEKKICKTKMFNRSQFWIDPETLKQFHLWRINRGLNSSDAIIEILKKFLKGEKYDC